jgi:hypothetical protein
LIQQLKEAHRGGERAAQLLPQGAAAGLAVSAPSAAFYMTLRACRASALARTLTRQPLFASRCHGRFASSHFTASQSHRIASHFAQPFSISL